MILSPLTEIDIINTKDQLQKSETFSSTAEIQIKKQLNDFIPDNIASVPFYCDADMQKNIDSVSVVLIKTVKRSSPVNRVKVPELFFTILDSAKQDYGLIILHTGFSRSEENLVNQYIRHHTEAIATLGLINRVPNKSYSTMIGLIVDRRNRKIAMYKELYWRNRDPNQKVVIKSQLRDVLLSYFQP